MSGAFDDAVPHSGSSIDSNPWRSFSPQVLRIIWKYGLRSSTQTICCDSKRLVSYTHRSSGSPTVRFDFSVESIDTSTHFAACGSGERGVIMRSSTGLPYLDSPIWKNGVSRVASMKLPAEYIR